MVVCMFKDFENLLYINLVGNCLNLFQDVFMEEIKFCDLVTQEIAYGQHLKRPVYWSQGYH